MLTALRKDRDTRVLVLSRHDLFKQLNGNPYSINTLAAFYKNPFVEDNDLTGIYRRLVQSDFYQSSMSGDNEQDGGNELGTQKPVLSKRISP